ncbi:MAG: transporter substrate-binding domain-containing protein, partial [Desulfobacteraceae bacterium]|nr:transporter substrate-binding domain-containing protein [Desulfobacteraceae bacterium]
VSSECPDKADIVAAAMTRTNDREMRIDFSQTYFVDRQRLLVKKTSAISSVCQLNGKLVGVVKGATTAENLRKETGICGATPEIREFSENSKAVEALKSGEIEAFATDSVALSKFAEEDPNLKITGEPFGREPYGIGIPNHDSRFRDLVNLTLQAMKADGTYNAIYCRWFPNTTPYPIEIWPGTIQNAELKGMTLTDKPQIADCSSQMPTDKNYKIRSGDTLSGIADRYFGDPLLWTYIWEANKEIIGSNYNLIRAGQILKIPEIPNVM